MDRNLQPQLCACGCGQYAAVDNRRNRVSKYVAGHNSRSSHPMQGKHHTPEVREHLASYTGEKASSFKHGWSRTPTYKTWSSMHGRCKDPRNASHKYYGARGITVCAEWGDFLTFVSQMGFRPPGMTLDRIDSNGNYERDNCRWATPEQQTANRRPNSDPGGWIRKRGQQH